MKPIYVSEKDVYYTPTLLGHTFIMFDTGAQCLDCGVVVRGTTKLRKCPGASMATIINAAQKHIEGLRP